MAMIFIDSMDLYSADSDLQAGGWILDVPSQITPQTSGGRFGGGCVLVQYITGPARAVTISGSTLIIQCAFKHSALTYATNKECVTIYNNSGADRCASLKINTNGSIGAYDASNSLVGVSGAGVIKENVWQYLEVKFVISDTGSITVKIDETQVINATSVDTKPGTATDIDKVKFQGAVAGAAQGIYYDDILFLDDSGSLNNDFIGDQVVTSLLPDSDDGTDAAWLSQPSQSVGSEYLNIDDTIPGAPDGDTSYNYSSTPADDSLYGFQNLAVTPASIPAVQLTLEAKKSDGGSRSVKHLFKGDTKIAGSAFNPGTTYEKHRLIREQSADASPVAWTAAKVNALLAGMRLES
jgi:hypothetical protein